MIDRTLNRTPFIAMEYLDGVTLREEIHHSGEPLGVLFGYLAQVAEGLAKAHHAGIVHRDLKPDNVMITRDGYAKILDFGLAKLVESRGPFGIDPAESDRTIGSVHQSTIGMVLGTIGYMSPEQASGRGHEIDHRSDRLGEPLPEPSPARRWRRCRSTHLIAIGASRGLVRIQIRTNACSSDPRVDNLVVFIARLCMHAVIGAGTGCEAPAGTLTCHSFAARSPFGDFDARAS